MNLLRKILIISALFLFALKGSAQNSNINVANMTNEQLMQLVSQYQLTGLTGPELEAKAKEKGLSSEQIQALKARLASASTLNQGNFGNLGGKLPSNFTDPYTQRKKIGVKTGLYKEEDSLSLNTLKVFGADIFEEEFLNFEPNLSIPSPKNYIIGTNDQLSIDVFGISERTQALSVNTEGLIRFPNLGPIKVGGLTLEEAQQKIKIALSKIYPTIANGKTQVNVSLGDIRSIRVTIVGEVKRPGSYSLSSLSTLMNALYTSGGPNAIGSFRNIYLMRNGKELVKFDLYDFLLKGDLSKNKLLMDEDVIRVAPYASRVAVKGAIKKQALYDVDEKESLGDILKYAGGFADMGHKDFVRVKRIGNKNKEVLTAKSNQFDVFNLISGDTILVDSIASSYSNRVHIKGSVYYPGEYGINEAPTLKDLLLLAQIKENSYFERASLIRLKSDYTPSFLHFNLSEVLNGKTNMKLEKEDSIYIYQKNDIKEQYYITINGEVNNPGTYKYTDSINLMDLILLAKGPKDGATFQKIEISRRIKEFENEQESFRYAIIKEIDIDKNSKFYESPNFLLAPFDIVSIRKSTAYNEQKKVSIEGEVLYPGDYILANKKERASDLIKRAGGLSAFAYSEGAILIRKTNIGASTTDSVVFRTRQNLIKNRTEIKLLKDTALIEDIYKGNAEKIVSFDLKKALQVPGGPDDLILEEGDILRIDKLLQTVETFGAVNIPMKISYDNNNTGLMHIIRASGGFAANADRNRSYVISANGKVRSTRKFLFFKFYPNVTAGAQIYFLILLKRDVTTCEMIAIGTTMASFVGLIISLINATK